MPSDTVNHDDKQHWNKHNTDIRNRRRLLFIITAFFLALAVPSSVMIYYAYDQLYFEAFHRAYNSADEFNRQVDNNLNDFFITELTRPVDHYRYTPTTSEINTATASPLSRLESLEIMPGVIGYFQIDSNDVFSTPLLPTPYSTFQDNRQDNGQDISIDPKELSPDELKRRRQKIQDLVSILSQETRTPKDTVSQKNTVAKSPHPATAEEGLSNLSIAEDESDADIAAEATFSRSNDDLILQKGNKKIITQARIESLAKEEKKTSKISAYQNLKDDALNRLVNEKPVTKRKEIASKDKSYEQLLEKRQKVAKPQARAVTSKAIEDAVIDSDTVVLAESIAVSSQSVAGHSAPTQTLPSRSVPTMIVEHEQANEEASVGFKQDALAAAEPPAPSPQLVAEADLSQHLSFIKETQFPLEIFVIDDKHLLAYRRIGQSGQYYIQGFLLDISRFFQENIGQPYITTALSRYALLSINMDDRPIQSFFNNGRDYTLARSRTLEGELIYRSTLPYPLNNFSVLYTTQKLPLGTGSIIILSAASIVLFVLLIGCLLFYRLGVKQLKLAEQQRNFISAVSHELKTPLTSIRMYSEILIQGWAPEPKKQEYYDYIFSESERLTRLINNVLQLAKLSKTDLPVNLAPHTCEQVADLIHSKVDTQMTQAGFQCNIDISPDLRASNITIDADLFIQVMINIIDNAIKFSRHAENKTIDIHFEKSADNQVIIRIRDYGPGVPPAQLKHLFLLFYRPENELTRETQGTGIGLSLVNQLIRLMNGTVDITNAEPGLELIIRLPLASA